MRDDPLGMPRGSVRGLVTIALVVTACIAFLSGREIPGELMALIGVAMTHYFVERRDQTRRADEAVAEEVPEQPYVPGDEPQDPAPPASL